MLTTMKLNSRNDVQDKRAIQGKCDPCEMAFVWDKTYSTARDMICPECGKSLRRTTVKSKLPWYLIETNEDNSLQVKFDPEPEPEVKAEPEPEVKAEPVNKKRTKKPYVAEVENRGTGAYTVVKSSRHTNKRSFAEELRSEGYRILNTYIWTQDEWELYQSGDQEMANKLLDHVKKARELNRKYRDRQKGLSLSV